MLRPILLLLALGGLAIFVFQNVSPVLPLVVFGVQTQALPVGLWVLGAIALGALTTFAIAALIRLGTPRPRRRNTTAQTFRSQPPPNNPPGSTRKAWTPPAWTGRSREPEFVEREPVDAPRRSTGRAVADDWEEPRPLDDWDDWEEPPTRGDRFSSRQPSRSRSVSERGTRPSESFREQRRRDFVPTEQPLEAPYVPPIYDAEVLSATPPEVLYENDLPGYEPRDYGSPDYRTSPNEPPYEATDLESPEPEKDVWDDWEEPPTPAPPEPEEPEEPEQPTRDFVEVRRDPQTRYQSGTVYSYSYRRDENADDTRRSAEGNASGETPVQAKTETKAKTEASNPAQKNSSQPEENNPRVIIPPTSTTKTSIQPEDPFDNPFGELPEDDSWEDWDTEFGSPSKSPDQPYQNPPLNLGDR